MNFNIDNTIHGEKIQASYFKQHMVGMVDAAFALLFASLLLAYLTPTVLFQMIAQINSTLVVVLGLVFYRMLALLFFNGTIGMNLFGVVLLNGEFHPNYFNR